MEPAERHRRFDEYLNVQRGRLVAIARVYAGHDADDLLQEILLQIWKSLEHFQDRSSIQTWGYRVAINTSLQWRRSQGRKRKHLPPENVDVNTIGRSSTGMDPARMLDQFLTTLAGTDKAVLIMHLRHSGVSRFLSTV